MDSEKNEKDCAGGDVVPPNSVATTNAIHSTRPRPDYCCWSSYEEEEEEEWLL